MSTFVRPTTANPKLQFYAACMTCGWQVYAPLMASVGVLAERHADSCPDANVEIDTVQYIGNQKTPAQRQLDEGHGHYMGAGTNEKTTAIVAATTDKPPVERG